MEQLNNIMLNKISAPAAASRTNAKTAPAQGESFSQVLGQKVSELQFSKHANTRINSREINLTNDQIKRVESGVDEAMQKGIKDSLVIVDGVALLVNINSRTVVTAMNSKSKNVFTNIDGAVIV